MTRDEFQAFMQDNHEKILALNNTKGADYAGKEDALANFKRQAETLGLRPEQIWAVYTSKHWDAVMTFVREGQVESESIEGRLLDVILYCHLLLALIAEEEESVH